jgi:hypothetical protein
MFGKTPENATARLGSSKVGNRMSFNVTKRTFDYPAFGECYYRKEVFTMDHLIHTEHLFVPYCQLLSVFEQRMPWN